MKDFIIQNLSSFGTGLIVGLLFSALRLAPPSPITISGVTGILGLTVGFIVFNHFFGK